MLAELQQEASALSRQLRAAMAAAAGTEGADPSGRVVAVLDAGGRVTNVRLARDWRLTLEPSGVGEAVVAACAEAGHRYVANWAEGVGHVAEDAASEAPAANRAPAGVVHDVTAAGKWFGPLWHGVTSMLEKFGALLEKFFSEVGKFLTRWGVPWTVYNHGQDWTDHVGAHASDLVAVANAGQLSGDDTWTGAAATAYAQIIPQQSTALAAIKDATDSISDILTKVAVGICAFWLGLLAVVVPFAVELATYLAAAGTVVGAPPAAAGSVLSTLKAIALLLAIVAAATTYLTMLYTSANDLDKRLHNANGFPQDSWPAPKVDLSDGRVHPDGTLDWHVKTS